jgi:hypothetical protein
VELWVFWRIYGLELHRGSDSVEEAVVCLGWGYPSSGAVSFYQGL